MACSFALSFFIIGIEVSVPKFIQHIIDVLLPGKRLYELSILIAVLGSLVVLMIGVTLINNRFQRFTQESAARDLQYALFDHLRKLGFSRHERNSAGDTLSLLNTEVNAVQEIYNQHFPNLIINVITFILSATLMFSINFKLGLIAVPSFLAYYLIGPHFDKKSARLGNVSQTDRRAFNKIVYDFVSALLELRVYRRTDWGRNQVRIKQENMHRSTYKLQTAKYLQENIQRVTIQLGTVAFFGYGTYLLSRGEISTGALVAFIFYFSKVIGDMTSVVSTLTQQKVVMNQVERLFDFFEEQPDVVESHSPVHLPVIQGNLSFHRVYFRYPGQTELIRNFSLQIRAGERVALVGTSGHGKSTLLKLIGRFYDPVQGEISLEGVSLRQLTFKQLRESMGFVFQETYLFGTSIKENIRFGLPDATDCEIIAAAKAAYAHDFIEQFPSGYETLIGERGVKLSGGQRQRISIARMFIKNPQIIVLDEATSALDNVSEWEVQQALQKLFIGRTTIAIAHRLSTVKDFDNIVVVEHGRIAEAGTYDQLIKQRGALFRLVEGEEQPIRE